MHSNPKTPSSHKYYSFSYTDNGPVDIILYFPSLLKESVNQSILYIALPYEQYLNGHIKFSCSFFVNSINKSKEIAYVWISL